MKPIKKKHEKRRPNKSNTSSNQPSKCQRYLEGEEEPYCRFKSGMDLNIIIRPKTPSTNYSVIKAGCIQFNRYKGTNLQAIGTATIWWKNKYIHARASHAHSVVTIDIPPNSISRQLHSGFSLEVLKNNTPIFYSEWQTNRKITNGFYLRINLEAIQQRQQSPELPLAAIYTRQPALHPINQEVYFN